MAEARNQYNKPIPPKIPATITSTGTNRQKAIYRIIGARKRTFSVSTRRAADSAVRLRYRTLKGRWRGFTPGIAYLRCHASAELGCLRHPRPDDETDEGRFASDCSLFHSLLYLWRMAAGTSHGLALGVVRNGIDRSVFPAFNCTSADRRYVLASAVATNCVRISSVRFSAERGLNLLCGRGCPSMADLSRRGQISLPGYLRQLRLPEPTPDLNSLSIAESAFCSKEKATFARTASWVITSGLAAVPQ